MEDSRLVNFALHGWVDYRKFKGASAFSAMLINVFLFIFKMAVCGGILLFLAPHLIAQKLWSANKRGILNRMLHILFTAVCWAMDIPVLLISAIMIMGGIPCLFSQQILTGVVMIAIGAVVGRWMLKCIVFVFIKTDPTDKNEGGDEDDDIEDVTVEEVEYEEEMEDEEDLRFCQLFTLGKEMCLLIDHVEMCPDETAFIRVVGDEGYTPIYKRKVKRDKNGGRFIVFNGYNYYLDDSKTQPTVEKK